MDFIKKAYREYQGFSQKLNDDSVGAYSAQSAFFVITSFFPFMLLLVTLVGFLPIDLDIEKSLSDNVFDTFAGEFISGVLAELSGSAASGALLGAVGVSAIWAASRCLLAIIKGLNQIYGAKEKPGFIMLQLTAIVYVLALQIIVIISLGILVFGETINRQIAEELNAPQLSQLALKLRWVVVLLILVLFFIFVYSVVPKRKTRLFAEMPGAVVSAVGWLGFSGLFSVYIDNFSNYGAVYGSLAAAVILMLWLYFCMYILFLGAEFNVYIQSKKSGKSIKEFLASKNSERTKNDKGN